jgi:hypothetical protein
MWPNATVSAPRDGASDPFRWRRPEHAVWSTLRGHVNVLGMMTYRDIGRPPETAELAYENPRVMMYPRDGGYGRMAAASSGATR